MHHLPSHLLPFCTHWSLIRRRCARRGWLPRSFWTFRSGKGEYILLIRGLPPYFREIRFLRKILNGFGLTKLAIFRSFQWFLPFVPTDSAEMCSATHPPRVQPPNSTSKRKRVGNTANRDMMNLQKISKNLSDLLRQGVDQRSVKALVNAFRRFGYLQANLDPLGLTPPEM